jgi:DHA2 family multidrug resistance protein
LKRSPPQSSSKEQELKTATLKEWIAFSCMVFGMFMAILDIQIVASSLNEIQAGLSASVDEIGWVQTSYLIAEVIMIPLSGFLARLLSTRILFVCSVVGFTFMSVACACAWSIESMIVFRALQGFMGGAMIPTVFSASFTMFGNNQRAVASIMVGLIATMAPTLGPTLGGYLTQVFSWHWLFLINLVPGCLVAISVWKLVHIDEPDFSLIKGFDFLGLALMAIFLGSLQFVLEEGSRKNWFEDDIIVLTAFISSISALFFCIRMFTYQNPIVDLRAYKDRNFSVGSLYSFIIGVGLYGSVYLIPLFLARIRGYNSLQIGQLMMITGVFQFLSAPIAGILSKKLEPRVMLAIGLVSFAVGLHFNSLLTADSSFWEFFPPQAIRGFSLMFCFIPINNLALGTLPPDQLKNASGLYNLMRNLGGALGLAVLNTFVRDRTALHYSRIADYLSTTNQVFQDTLLGLMENLKDVMPGLEDLAALKVIFSLTQRQSLIMAFNDAFLFVSSFFICSIFFMPLIRKPKFTVKEAH